MPAALRASNNNGNITNQNGAVVLDFTVSKQHPPQASQELSTLVQLYQVTQGSSSWKLNDGNGPPNDKFSWLTSERPCDWEGVTCNDDDYVTSLDLSGYQLTGRLPLSLLWGLEELEYVDVSQNPELVVDFATPWILLEDNEEDDKLSLQKQKEEDDEDDDDKELDIDEDDDEEEQETPSVPSIRYLNISATATSQLQGIDALATTLEALDISATPVNNLTALPSMFQNLQTLVMNHLMTTNPIPLDNHMLSNPFLHSLQTWRARNSSLTGTISGKIGQFKQLQILDFSYNALEGELSIPEINSLRNLQQLELQSQRWNDQDFATLSTIEYPYRTTGLSGPLPSLGNATQLTYIDLSGNRLTGTVPDDFLMGLSDDTVAHLPITILLNNNELEGALPVSLQRMGDLFLDITDNFISELPEELCEEQLWMNYGVARYGCQAIACLPGTYNQAGRQKNVNMPCEECDSAMFYGSTDCLVATTPILAAEERTNLQQAVLAEFFAATGGVNWKQNTGWTATPSDNDDDNDVCSWFGVLCAGGRVRELYLPDNNLQGTTPASLLVDLPQLRRLFLQRNYGLDVNFEGLLAQPAPKLEDLILSETSTSNLEGIANATNLVHLNLEATQISGPAVEEVFTLTKLKTLNLGNTSLAIALPESIGDLASLVSLQAPQADLRGALPERLGELKRVVLLDLSANSLEGPLPDALNDMEELRILDLHGQIPASGADWFGGSLLDFSQLGSILQLDLSYMGLTGEVPSTFLSGVREDNRLMNVSLKGNLLEGALPEELSTFRALTLDVTENRIDSVPKSLCNNNNWMNGLVAEFGCDAFLCPPGTSNQHGRIVSEETPCVACPGDLPSPSTFYGSMDCLDDVTSRFAPPTETATGLETEPSLEPSTETDTESSAATQAPSVSETGTDDTVDSILDVASDVVGGQVNASVLPEREVLELLYGSTGGQQSWIRKDNWLSNNISICEWYGVGCGRHGQIESLVLSDNGLQGTTPLELFQLSQLQRLYMDGNYELAVDLSGITLNPSSRLSAMVISNTLTTSVSGLSYARMLQVLDLSSTEITGDILDEVVLLTNLKSLNIGNTDMNREMPATISALSGLRELSAANSGIVGEIPDRIGELANLTVLDLARNALSGTLPASMQDLTNIRILNLQHQQNSTNRGLQGPLLSFENLGLLEKVDLSENQLSSPIPDLFILGVVDKDSPIEVDLSDNLLVGSLPASLEQFSRLHIDVTSNRISNLPPSLCLQKSWMEGATADYGCDAILCPPNTFNADGRQVSEAEPCAPCLTGTAPFYGAISCPDNVAESQNDVAICPDGRVCYNGGACEEDDEAMLPGSYKCNCTGTAQEGEPFAGFACEYQATVICHDEIPDKSNITAFCTNNGVCRRRVPTGAEHRGCFCDSTLWEGEHCELKVTQFSGPDVGVGDQFILPSGNDEGDKLETWEMILIFVLPALAIFATVALIIVAYSRKKRQRLKYVNADNIVDSEYDKFRTRDDDPESPRDFSKNDPSISELETPSSIIDRALMSVPDEPHTNGTDFFSLPDTISPIKHIEAPETNGTAFYSASDGMDKAVFSDEDENVTGSRGDTARQLWPDQPVQSESSMSATTSISKSSEPADSPDAAGKIAASQADGETKAAAFSSSTPAAGSLSVKTLSTKKSVRIDETPTVTLVEDISQFHADSDENSDDSDGDSDSEYEEEMESDEDGDFLADAGELEALAAAERTRRGIADISDDDSNFIGDIDDVHGVASSDSNFIGDIEDSHFAGNVPHAMGKSLFAGVQKTDDSVSFLENSVGMSDDSERSDQSFPQEQRFHIAVEPGLAQTMFSDSRQPSETSSGELSLNF